MPRIVIETRLANDNSELFQALKDNNLKFTKDQNILTIDGFEYEEEAKRIIESRQGEAKAKYYTYA